MLKEYKILNLQTNHEQETSQEALLAELSEVKIIQMGTVKKSHFDLINGEIFIVIASSPIGQYLMNKPDDIKKLKLSEFHNSNITLDGVKRDAYYHIDYINDKNQRITSSLKPEFLVKIDTAKKVLADLYFNEILSNEHKIVRGSWYDELEFRELGIEKNPDDPELANACFNFADYMFDNQDFEDAKLFYLKAAEMESADKGNAYFALGCVKILRNENGDEDLLKAVEAFKNRDRDLMRFAQNLLDVDESKYRITENLRFSAKKKNGEISFSIDNGNYSPASIDLSMEKIRRFFNKTLKRAYLEDLPNGKFELEYVFIDPLPDTSESYDPVAYHHIRSCESQGFTFEELSQNMEKLNNELLDMFRRSQQY